MANIVIRTDTKDLRTGDKVYVVGRKRPVEVKSVDGKIVRYAGGVAIQKDFERVVTKMSEVLR